jgi:oxygen-independent coproporphyrinogen-3 oxidase
LTVAVNVTIDGADAHHHLAAAAGRLPQAAYVHIPFCRRRCFYCDFPVSVIGDRRRGETSGTIAHYIEVLCQEIQLTPPSGPPLSTIFLGGGTPSLLSVQQLTTILETLQQQFGIAAHAEISMEIDPGTCDRQHLQGYYAVGVNRISLGVQAFQPELLQLMGRTHTVEEIYTTIALIREVGVSNLSLDLISGLPHQTLAQWHASLEAAVALQPTHLSAYDLIVEPGTAFDRQYQPGCRPFPPEETTAQMYRMAQQVLTSAGYEHYEISNYALPGYQCRHNRIYWENRPFYGFGMGSASYLQEQRLTRPRKLREYHQWVQTELTRLLESAALADVSRHEILLETLMLGLRLADGLNLAVLASQFGKETLVQVWNCLQSYYQQGWVEWIPEPRQSSHSDLEDYPGVGYLRLSDPEGFLFSNTILADLFAALA